MNFHTYYTAYYAYYAPFSAAGHAGPGRWGHRTLQRWAKKSPDAVGIGGLGRYGCLYRVTVASTLPTRGLWTVRVKGVPGWALTT